MKYSHHPLPPSYLDIINQSIEFKLMIVGKDPFPTAPTGIPFCKASWEEQLRDNNSGFHVLRSLGTDIQYASTNYPTPSAFFHELAAQGIAFLNCSYHFLDTLGLPVKDHIYVDQALSTNEPIIRKADNVLLCGEAKILEEKIKGVNCFQKVIHPDVRNRGLRADEWHKWWTKDALSSILI